MKTPTADDRRWQRILQPSRVAYDPAALIGGNVKVDPVVADMNDLARFLELTAMAPVMVGPLMSMSAGSVGTYWDENVFTWDSTTGELKVPQQFAACYARFADEPGILVAPLKLNIQRPASRGKTETLSIWNYILFDRDHGGKTVLVDRLDPDDSVDKTSLDDAIEKMLATLKISATYRRPAEAGKLYRDLVKYFVIPWDCPDYVHLNMWTYWLLHVRLAFSDLEQGQVWVELSERLLNHVMVGNVLLNFYPSFTSDANLHTFGSLTFLESHTSSNDLWQYEQMVAKRVHDLSCNTYTDNPLNRILSAAIGDFITSPANEYPSLYKKYVGAVPWNVPKCQDCVDWMPVAEMGEDLKALLSRGFINYGYVANDPYIILDSKGEPESGLDYEMALGMTKLISNTYAKSLSVKGIEARFVKAPPVPPSGDSVADNFKALYAGLETGIYDVAMAGQMVLPASATPAGANPVWTPATALIYPAVTYTGKGDLDFSGVTDLSSLLMRIGEILEKNKIDLSVFSVINPGPSPGSAQSFVQTINNALKRSDMGRAMWASGTVAEAQSVFEQQIAYFSIGDAIASGSLCLKYLKKTGKYFNFAAVSNPSIHYDATVRSATLMPVAAFTLPGR